MSELTNPLFDDPREFLERQKEEYKNALLSDVTELKDQSQQVGKSLLIAGGALAGIYLLSRAFSKKKEPKQPKKKKSNRLENPARFKGAEDRDWISSIPDVEDDEPLYSAIERTYPAIYHPTTGTIGATYSRPRRKKERSSGKGFFQSDLFKILEQQVAALAIVYLTKLIEERYKASSNTTTATTTTQPILVEETTTIEYELQPDDTITDAQTPQSPFIPHS